MLDLILSPLFLYSFIAALLVGISAPVVGTYLVHRRLAMLGDGIGHVALTGVAVGWLIGSVANLSPIDRFAVPGAIITSIGAAVIIELVRRSGRTSADVVLALLFYGGIAAGVVLIGLAGGSSTQLNSYLFGSLATVSRGDLILIAVMSLVIFAIGIGLRPLLFSVTNDEDFARSSGLPVDSLSMLVAIMSAVTVAVSMRVVGALLVSAIMVIPVATAQMLAKSFSATMMWGMLIGAVVSVVGLAITFQVNISPGATIVVLAVAVYGVTFIVRSIAEKAR